MVYIYSTQFPYVLCFIIIIAYVSFSFWKKSPPQLQDTLFLVFAVFTIPSCIKIITIFFNYDGHSIKQIGESEKFYIIIGAFVGIWLAFVEIYKKFNEKINPKDKT